MSVNLLDVWCSRQEFLPRCWRRFSSWNSLIDSYRGNLGDSKNHDLLFSKGVTYAGALVLFASLRPSFQRDLLQTITEGNDESSADQREGKTKQKRFDFDPSFFGNRVESPLLVDAPETEEVDTPKQQDDVCVGEPESVQKTEEEIINSFVEDAVKRAALTEIGDVVNGTPLRETSVGNGNLPKESPAESTILSPTNGDPSWTPLQQRLHKGVLEKYKNWRDGRDYAERMSDAWGVVTFLLEKRKGVDLNKKKNTHNARVKNGKLQPGEDTKRWSSLTDVIYGLALDADAYTIVAEMFPLPMHEEPHPELLRGMTTYPVLRTSRMGWGASSLS